ncbi:hypothetical protein POL68_23365 [Stigmatella sp. ncwal1]|uniref:DUF2125 domain-containing protein n=1 Tax=Stigmatella ashevillensis TaxID=2995309 RepID=A0ABT5DCM3_9BACT|nr:hypothetical protein [Stigmatella ashevillena]MDC0711430.1 hypothetical protein [Stigmatella ashevillena]
MPFSIQDPRGMVLLMLVFPVLSAAAIEGAEFIFRFDKPLPVADQTARQWLEHRAAQLFGQGISYAWPQAGDSIVLSIPRQQPEFIAESGQALRVRLREGIEVLVGVKTPPWMPPSAWSQPADGGVRVHGFINLKMFADAVAQHLKGSRFILPHGDSSMQSLELRTSGDGLEASIQLSEQDAKPGVLIMRGTPRFVAENGTVSLTVPDAEVTYNGKPFGALQVILRTQRLWKLDVDMASIATKAEAFFEFHTGSLAKATVTPFPDLQIEVVGNHLLFTFSLNVTLTYTYAP